MKVSKSAGRLALTLLAAIAVEASLIGCVSVSRQDPFEQEAVADEFIIEAKSRVLLRTPPGSGAVFENVARHDVEDMITVCGSVRLRPAEPLPFFVSWKRHEALSQAIVLVPLFQGETPATQPRLGQQIFAIEEFCKGVRLRSGEVSPPSPSPPNITPAQYIESSRAEILQRLAEIPQAGVIAAEYAKDAKHVVVCGRAVAEGQELPFTTIWRYDEPLDQGASMIAIWGANTPADDPRLNVFTATVRNLCERMKLGHLLPSR